MTANFLLSTVFTWAGGDVAMVGKPLFDTLFDNTQFLFLRTYVNNLLANETRTTTTLSDVPELSFNVDASQLWLFLFTVQLTSPVAGDIKYTITAPTGATGRFGLLATGTLVTVEQTTFGSAVATNTFGFDEMHLVGGFVINGTNPGAMQLQAAQQAASGTATIYAGSGVLAARLA